MRLRLLGPVELECDGTPVSVGGPRAQAVLAVLAVRADEIVTADWLVDQLWGERPPRTARVSLQTYVSRLRGISAPVTERLLPRHPRGYLVDGAAAEIDARRFTRLSEQGRAAASERHWPEALRDIRGARDLWRGIPFTGIDGVPALSAERHRLAELRTENRFTESQALLEVKGPADVIGPLRELVDAHRWDERGWRLLMLALYRAGRQTEALEIAATARRLLIEEQGLDPSPALAQLEHQILVHDPALAPRASAPIRSRGWLDNLATPLIGRDRELAELRERWARVNRDQRSQLVLVEGEPGVGKSHLVTHLAEDAAAAGATVLVGRCFDEPRLPLQPWPDLVPEAASRWPGPTAEPGEGQSMIDIWEVAAHRLFAAITQRFAAALESGPALMVAEDLHWAGVAALRLLGHVLASCASNPLLAVATVRSSAAGMPAAARGAFGELCARTRPHTLKLGGLEEADLRPMLASHGHHVSAGEAAAVWERTGGVPLLAMEALRGGQGILAARLGQVSGTASGLAELLAVAGDRCPFPVLRNASRLDDEALCAAFDELISAGLVSAAPGVVICHEFTHALYREAIDAQLPELRRVAISRRLLAAGAGLPAQVPPSALARHAVTVARSGIPDDLARARDECQRAGASATSCHEHHEAARWVAEAIALAGQAGTSSIPVAELELAHGLACRRAGLPGARESFLRAAARARTAGDRRLLARIGLGWSRGFFSQVGTVDADFVTVLREALQPPGELPASLRARAMAALAAELTWADDGDERFALAERALETARASGDAATLAHVLRTRHLTVAAADTLAIRRREAAELLEIAGRSDDVGLRFEALFHRCGPAIEDGELGLLERLLGEAGQIADVLRQPALQWNVGWSRASLLLWQGALPAAEKLAQESFELGDAAGHHAEAMAFFGGQLLEIRRLQGRLGELAPMLLTVPAAAPDGFAVARYLCAAGHIEAAAARLDRVTIEHGRLRLRRDLLERPSLDNLAFLAARLNRPELAAAVGAQLEPLAGTFGHGVVAHPIGHHWLGVLALARARPAEAIGHLRAAVARHTELELPLLEAESRLELARAHEARGDATAAAEARASAGDLAAGLGAAGLVAEPSRS
ncbi:MAG TPA: BTAD domain-containing putative transcriptional regulator [Pseudonocardiaceae bacterium]|nr:BTAD domain-containing putative transcriptional regulator [Pseudonocardiaceae bacterium]